MTTNNTETGVCHATGKTRFNILEPEVAGDNGSQTGIIAVIEYLIELLLRPGCGALAAQVIQYQ